MHRSLTEIENAIRVGWCRWTSDPVDQHCWSADNPSWGQCASTALVVQDLFEGDLLLADVRTADGTRAGVHFWNRLANGSELDLTREQFRSGEEVGEPHPVSRPVDVTRGRLPGQYHLLASRVSRLLSGGNQGSAAWPVTVKAVCVDGEGRALLCRNHRNEWELPGGRPEVGELFHDTAAREIKEETGLSVRADRLIGADAIQAAPERWVDIIAYDCPMSDPVASRTLRSSKEHTSVAFIDPATLPDDELPRVYKRLLGAARRSS